MYPLPISLWNGESKNSETKIKKSELDFDTLIEIPFQFIFSELLDYQKLKHELNLFDRTFVGVQNDYSLLGLKNSKSNDESFHSMFDQKMDYIKEVIDDKSTGVEREEAKEVAKKQISIRTMKAEVFEEFLKLALQDTIFDMLNTPVVPMSKQRFENPKENQKKEEQNQKRISEVSKSYEYGLFKKIFG